MGALGAGRDGSPTWSFGVGFTDRSSAERSKVGGSGVLYDVACTGSTSSSTSSKGRTATSSPAPSEVATISRTLTCASKAVPVMSFSVSPSSETSTSPRAEVVLIGDACILMESSISSRCFFFRNAKSRNDILTLGGAAGDNARKGCGERSGSRCDIAVARASVMCSAVV